MEAFLFSTGIVALGEMGDKTQLLAMILALRYRRPVPIIFAILLATLLNHALAGAVGQAVASFFAPETLRWIIGLSFLAMAVWILIPDKVEDDMAEKSKYGVFLTTFIAFFVAEMGDKTQIATVALAAHYTQLWLVVIGTTLGMMIANVPAVFLGDALSKRLSMKTMHIIAAILFVIMGLFALFGADQYL